MMQNDDATAIDEVIDEVRALTHAIATTVEHVEDLIDRRLAAIRRMHNLADRNVIVAGVTATVEALSSRRTPPLLNDIVHLAVLETGDHGASMAVIRNAVGQRYNRIMDPDALTAALHELVRNGRILDRGTRYFAPTADLSRNSGTAVGPTIKAMVVEALENTASEGLAPPEIKEAITARHGRHIPMTSLYPIIRQLEHSGRLAKSGRRWMLVNRSATAGE